MFFWGRDKNLCKICRKDFEKYRPLEDRDCGLCFNCFKQYKENVIKSTPNVKGKLMCKLCEEEEKNKLKDEVYLYKKFIAKMAYKDIQSIIDLYQLKGVNIKFDFLFTINIDDQVFTERELKEYKKVEG